MGNLHLAFEIGDADDIFKEHGALIVCVLLGHTHKAFNLAGGQVGVHYFTDVSVISPHLADKIFILSQLK